MIWCAVFGKETVHVIGTVVFNRQSLAGQRLNHLLTMGPVQAFCANDLPTTIAVPFRAYGLFITASGLLALGVHKTDKDQPAVAAAAMGFVTLSAFSRGECGGQQLSCGGGCPGPSAE